MIKIKINGVDVELPFEPYESQKICIENLITAFKNSSSALIESPTGTGKSISILCSALAYQKHHNNTLLEKGIKSEILTGSYINKEDFIEMKENYEVKKMKGSLEVNFLEDKIDNENALRIYICSRTHKQIDQLIDQLRKTNYTPKMAILGSREQYCINAKAKMMKDLDTTCNDLVKKQNCQYFKGYKKLVKNVKNIHDIEELKVKGKKCSGCPFFAARDLVAEADVIFAPYNYLIDPNIRDRLKLTLNNSIIIIDEAHNIEDCCRSAGSMEMTSKVLDMVHNELVVIKGNKTQDSIIKENLTIVMEFLWKFRTSSGKVKCDVKNYKSESKIAKGKNIIQELEELDIKIEDVNKFNSIQFNISRDEILKEILSISTNRFLENLSFILSSIYFGRINDYVYCFTRNLDNNEYVYNFWLMNPAAIFKQLINMSKSVCLLSGTLTPFKAISYELGMKSANKIIAPHILKKEQVFISNVSSGHLNKELCGTYKIVETKEYKDQIAKIIIDIGEVFKQEGGVLVFVPSYLFLKNIQMIIKNKAIYEPQVGGLQNFEKLLKSYKDKLLSKKPAILICVFRGKASEGIDFKDNYARAVITIGIPYPAIKDPQITSKMEYNDRMCPGYNGRNWYACQAFKALSQALGRVVRHEKDWGAIYLIDSRFTQPNIQKQLPSWIVENMKSYKSFEDSKKSLEEFISKK
ncbi:FANCJ [Hepatospora eriocheir]|uniref:DNA 5'-3' helicase n=1 Tax=Hepatospora eriocheir TaxID=1081669 RepID=A0A1X0QLM1_9MICR|nr:FANCJ [Hepatospora eriocheir]